MSAFNFTFTFANDPTGEGEDGPLRVSVIAHSEEEAWQRIARQLKIQPEALKEYLSTIQRKEIRAGEIVLSRSPEPIDTDDPWPQVFLRGIREVTRAISETVGATHKDRIQVELARINIDRLVLIVFSIALL